MSYPLRVLGISGSLRKHSVNSGLLRHCGKILAPRANLDIIPSPLIGSLPIFNEDIEDEANQTDSMKKFRSHLNDVDAILFAACEYNGSMSSAMKNCLDWGSRGPYGNMFDGKPVAIIGAGGYGGTTRAQGEFSGHVHRNICLLVVNKYARNLFRTSCRCLL